MVLFFFFFQAEDGIRYLTVTGVQTCASDLEGVDLRLEQEYRTGERQHEHERDAQQPRMKVPAPKPLPGDVHGAGWGKWGKPNLADCTSFPALHVGCSITHWVSMSRKLRIHVPNSFYHATLRGNHRQNLFRVESDRKLLNAIVARAIDLYDSRIHA